MTLNGRPVYIDEAVARFSHAVTTDRPFLERLTQFWTNHFAVSVDKVAVLGLAGAMEREAIRPNVTGSFTQLLMAVENAPKIAAALVEGGRPADTPVAVIMDGTMPDERTVLSTLGTLAADLVAEGVTPPAIIVIGEVVAVARPERYGR